MNSTYAYLHISISGPSLARQRDFENIMMAYVVDRGRSHGSIIVERPTLLDAR